MIACACANCQSTSLPSIIVDSIIWRLNLGRACDTLQAKQATELNALSAVVFHQGQRITLSNTKITQLEDVIKLMQEQGANQKEVAQIKNEKLKIRIRKLVRFIVIESGIIVVLVILII